MFNDDKARWHHQLNLYTVYKSFLGVKIKCGNFHVAGGGKTAGEQRMKSEDEPILMDWSFLCVAACFADFFTAQVPWYTEDLSGPDMLWVSYLVAIGSIQEGP